MQAVYHLDTWIAANQHLFSPPVCNKLMHKRQLSIMCVGGPNVRTDFHLEQGSEFFWMIKGNMELPTIQQGALKIVHIREGEVYLLPSRIPHSPQRPEAGSLGLVVERERYLDAAPPELDGLRWYVDFATCDTVLWERYFHCGDLGRDLVPVVQAFHASDEKRTGVPGANVLLTAARPVQQDETTSVPAPVCLSDWLAAHAAELELGQSLSLFGADHPDKEFKIQVVGGPGVHSIAPWKGDTWVFQLRGTATVTVAGQPPQQLFARHGGVVPPDRAWVVEREAGSIGFVIAVDALGNKPPMAHPADV